LSGFSGQDKNSPGTVTLLPKTASAAAEPESSLVVLIPNSTQGKSYSQDPEVAEYQEDYDILLKVPDDLKEDLQVWAAAVEHATAWMPICMEIPNPPNDSMRFTSDAAGGLGSKSWLGVASLGHTRSNGFWFLCRGKWPISVRTLQDEEGKNIGLKKK
jgi:hypothetical protein